VNHFSLLVDQYQLEIKQAVHIFEAALVAAATTTQSASNPPASTMPADEKTSPSQVRFEESHNQANKDGHVTMGQALSELAPAVTRTQRKFVDTAA
jgi:hypothetical protein